MERQLLRSSVTVTTGMRVSFSAPAGSCGSSGTLTAERDVVPSSNLLTRRNPASLIFASGRRKQFQLESATRAFSGTKYSSPSGIVAIL